MCRNIDKSSFKIGRTIHRTYVPSPSQTLKRANDDSGSLVRMPVVVSKLYDVTDMQTKKTRAHFSRVSFCEIL